MWLNTYCHDDNNLAFYSLYGPVLQDIPLHLPNSCFLDNNFRRFHFLLVCRILEIFLHLFHDPMHHHKDIHYPSHIEEGKILRIFYENNIFDLLNFILIWLFTYYHDDNNLAFCSRQSPVLQDIPIRLHHSWFVDNNCSRFHFSLVYRYLEINFLQFHGPKYQDIVAHLLCKKLDKILKRKLF